MSLPENGGPGKRYDFVRARLIPYVLVGLGGLLLLTAAVLLYLSNRPAVGFPRVGSRMVNFSLRDLDGDEVRLRDYAGRTVLINAWATWCPPCRAEMPMLVSVYQERKGSGFAILAINAGETREEAATFAVEHGMDFPVLLDSDSALLDSLLIDSLPTTILVGPDGVVKVVHIGVLSPEAFAELIAPLIP
jgi:thiol-disulfide isomerase/thioredoxin